MAHRTLYMSRKVALAAAFVVAAAAVVVVNGPAIAETAQPQGFTAPASPDGEVTLLTGDRVTIRSGRPEVRPGPGREGVAFSLRTDVTGDLHVVPADAQTDLTAGRLDPRLFDVSALIRDGYDDTAGPVTPLIVTYDGPATGIAGTSDARALPSVNGYAMTADKSANFLAGARTAGVAKVWLDGPVRSTLDHSVGQVGAPQAWQSGHTGRGTTVAVLDTGVDQTHPDLADAVVESRNFTDSDTDDDRVGHGTHVAATITGSGKYQGVAPDSKVLNGKVLDDRGSGRDSTVIAGMEWAAAAGADVINMSLGSSLPSDGTDLLSQAVDRLTADTGALFVVSAGNRGPAAGTIGSPAAASSALTVGSVDRTDALADSSSRGPRPGDGAVKPEITAPGVGIVAARARNGTIGEPVGDSHVALSGTSMAAPHVAGAAAILAGQHPDWTADRLKTALTGSAEPNPARTVHEQGSGRLDVARAVRQSVTASPAVLNFGTALWPHHDDAPIVRTVTYANHGSTAITLRVDGEARGVDGRPAPGMVTASPSEVTVPAGGQADVTITTTTALDTPDGGYSGAVVASGDGTSVRTPLTVTKEIESYDVKLAFIDGEGQPTTAYSYRFDNLDRRERLLSYETGGALELRLPKGRYFFEAFVGTQQHGGALTAFPEPELVVSGKTELVMDARRGKQAAITLDKPDAQPGDVLMAIEILTEWGYTNSVTFGPTFAVQPWEPSSTSRPGRARFTVEAKLAQPDGTGRFHGSPYQYNVLWRHDGGVPDDLHRTFTDRDFAEVRTVSAAQGPGAFGFRNYLAAGPLPLRVTEYYTPGVPWTSMLSEMDPDTMYQHTKLHTALPREFEAGAPPRTEKWNAAVFSPAFPMGNEMWNERNGDYVYTNIPMFTDQAADRIGSSGSDQARTTLSRDGVVLAQTEADGYVAGAVPADKGTYELRAEVTRSGMWELSTSITSTWTFTSEHAETPTALPLLAVRFAPVLDDRNRAHAGRPFVIPVYAQRNGSPTATGVRTPEIEVSYDDGKSWQRARVGKLGERWLALVEHPADAKFVSLRAKAQDADGNTVDETIIRAYGLK
ncbi:hypothetical protein ALI22I_30195 [Saccharothrix sp. ALI-22-I]|uniref:S8 family serine peptidase n=1 Tax=Saccharothrix sp. ALI-22-I TaxID=1933778 RepID=UPI00097C2B78|nr:S8 family serine peptidase [Saccharothrix sp. ALI-22-I]ONI84768.1 hypothetical protein ALI22I_30195 [Saccharothrix sp. ALI-22-I]